MERGVDVRDLRSHPDRSLIGHLEGVKSRSLKAFERISKYVDWERTFGFKEQEVRKTLEVAALLHDLGKATESFQKKLRGKLGRVRGGHALLSSIFTLKKLLDEGLPLPLAFCGYSIVRHHHTHLVSPQDERISPIDEETFEYQMKEIHPQIFEYLGLDPHVDIEALAFELEDAADEAEDRGKSFYFLMKLLYSILTYSDRADALFKEEDPEIGKLESSKVKEYLSSLKSRNWLDDLRKEFQRELMDVQIPEEGIFTIRAPTGIGKTLGNIMTALRAGKDGIVVYTLPFINIIEQTADVMRRIFGSGAVLEYHHLAQTLQADLDEVDLEEISKIVMMRDLWMAPLVVITFVSLLENLIGGGKAPFFHRLIGGVLILDEVQAIPKEVWKIVKEVVEFLPKIGINVILLTATLPVIFNGVELLKNPEKKYFVKLNRTRVQFDGKMGMEDFKEYLDEMLSDGKRTLIILNTIRSAEEVYDFLSQKYEDICFLSSRVVPKDRRERIRRIKSGDVKICVTTQVVEAGVDISFERVVRDIGPLDSIIQAAGRCNRNFEFENGLVKLVALHDDKTLLAKYVYGSSLVEHSLRILSKLPEFDERDFPGVVKKYYNMIVNYTDVDKERYVDKLNRVDISQLSSFKLIREGQTVSFLVLLDNKAEEIFRKALEISENMESFKRRDVLSIVLSKLSDYTVSTRIDLTISKEFPAFDEYFGMVVINRELAKEWYDPIKGLRDTSSGGGYFV